MNILRAKDRIISAIYNLVRLVGIVSLYVIVPIAGVVVFLYLAEFLHPDQVHVINKDLTTGIVDELVSDGKHHAAIYIMENNSGFLAEADNRREFLENICRLTDCYMHVGDFDKAQQILQLRVLRGTTFIVYRADSHKSIQPQVKKHVRPSIGRG